ncbi:nucleolin-like [Prunus persica]|uniref:nucleolin-like n=1 Tax=Prunus persica TaxID=3760 RepID=UPI0009AB332A|nr:nucleolin-like [Prunus persica]
MKKEQTRRTSKPKGQQSSSKTKTNKKPSRWEDPNYVQIKSNMLSFATTIDNIRQRLERRNDVLTLLSKTPFWTLIDAYMQRRLTKVECMKSNYDIVRLIQVYDTKTKKVRFNDGDSEMKSQDVDEIFGLPNRGKKLPSTTTSTRPDLQFVKKYFTGYKKITKSSIDKCLNLALEDETEEGAMDYWLCQISNLFTPIPGREEMTPAAVKWSLQELNAKLNHIKNNQIRIKSTKAQEPDDDSEEENEENDDDSEEENEEEDDAAKEVNEEHDDAAEEENEENDDAAEEVNEEHGDAAEEENEEEEDAEVNEEHNDAAEHQVQQHHQRRPPN